MPFRLILLAAFMFVGCCNFVSKSEWIDYRGKLSPIGMLDSVEIFSSNRGRTIFVDSGIISTQLSTIKPDSNGHFLVAGTTPTHNDCESPNHWEGGPLEIFIRGPRIQNYHDTLSVEELKLLLQLNPDSLGVKIRSNVLGIWQIPDIQLMPQERNKIP